MTVKPVIPLQWCAGNANMGDMVGPFLVKQMTGFDPVLVNKDFGYIHLVICGSILNWANDHSVVWGAGLACRQDGVNSKALIQAVRGPISRELALNYGVDCPEVYGDPSLLLPRYIPKPSTEVKYELGIIPHFIDWQMFPPTSGSRVKMINVLRPLPDVVADICACKRVVSSSLHGIILADAYGVPNAWWKFSGNLCGDGTKFHDYAASVGRELKQNEAYLTVTTADFVASATDCARPFRVEALCDGLMRVCPLERK